MILVAPAAFIGLRCYGQAGPPPARSEAVQRVASDLAHYYRAEAATYLTLPEWYIVYSTEEYASFIGRHPPSRFPYFRAVGQYWRIYAGVCRATRAVYPFDPGVHFMLGVIGTSFSLENLLKGAYEATLGRLTEWLGSPRTEEDVFAYRTAREYGRFMHTTPWYEYPFGARLSALWRQTGFWGRHPVRKWERKLALSAEYSVKAGYAWLVRQGTGAVYAPEELTTHLWLGDAPDAIFADSRVRRVKEVAPRSFVVAVPRYAAFTDVVTGLARQGVRFLDIAGNRVMLLTAIVPRDWAGPPETAELVLEAEILTRPAVKRIALRAPVPSLHAVLRDLERRGATIEHLYDY